MQMLVKQIRWEANDVVSLTLVDPDGGELPTWEPGAHAELHLPPGVVRHYSLCGSPANRFEYQVAVLKEPASRGGSRFLHEELRVGTTLDVRTLRNNFRFTPTPRVEFIAGGIGITPLMTMVREAQARGVDWRLWYGGRSRRAMAFLSELGEIDENRILLFPADECELIDLAAALGHPDENASVYCCGPESLLAAVEVHCRAWPAGSLHLERFAAPKSSTSPAATSQPPKAPGSSAAGDTFEVIAQVSGVEVTVSPDQSILDVLEEANVVPSFSCREGICGSCEVKVLEGRPEHRDLILTDEEKEEGNTMMICVSRSQTPRLVLEL